jgi:threonine/homoserine/homoserine lactone efflux protein
MTGAGVTPILAGLTLGLALAGAPGPVQAVLLTEAVRGGVGRGFRALAGASVTFGVLLVAVALGISVASPSGLALRVLEVVGGALLLWLAVDGFRSDRELDRSGTRRALPPAARGSLAVLLNPGAWIFLGAVASPLFASAAQAAGRTGSLLAALALVVGLGIGDTVVVLLGGLGMRRASERIDRLIRRVLAVILGGLGVWLVIDGIVP